MQLENIQTVLRSDWSSGAPCRQNNNELWTQSLIIYKFIKAFSVLITAESSKQDWKHLIKTEKNESLQTLKNTRIYHFYII